MALVSWTAWKRTEPRKQPGSNAEKMFVEYMNVCAVRPRPGEWRMSTPSEVVWVDKEFWVLRRKTRTRDGRWIQVDREAWLAWQS